MQNIKDYLYILALKTYLIDRKSEMFLDNKFLMNIQIKEVGKWIKGDVLYHISFFVTINNGKDMHEIVYDINSWRNLSTILTATNNNKINFIFNRTFLSLNRYYRITTEGRIKNKEISNAVLKETSKQLQDLINNKKTKIKKK